MFEINDNLYELRFSLKRIEMIEKATNKGIMVSLSQGNGMLSISELKTYLAYGLINDNGNYISPAQGLEYAEALIKQEGYVKVSTEVINALERDCAFLFQTD